MQLTLKAAIIIIILLLVVDVVLTWRNQRSKAQLALLKTEFINNRQELEQALRQNREELNGTVANTTDSLLKRINETSLLQNQQTDIAFAHIFDSLNILTKSNETRMDKMRDTVETRLSSLQADNRQQLEQMRLTVDEKLNVTLEKRLGESFRLVSERLELVHKGLGEMQTLAIGVGDLKRVLTNVKNRGILGELQLGNILEQLLTAEQYDLNVVTKPGSNARVEFAVKLPGRDRNNSIVWLPIDSKFPLESYQRMLDAYDVGNMDLFNIAGRELEQRVKQSAKDIHDKYLDPPHTTDFGIMFLPIEGLFAEVLRRRLFEVIQKEFNVIIAGPTTLSALLNSLQLGFRTLAIEKRSSEVWTLLGTVKTEFGKFGDLLDKTQKKLQEASNTIEAAGKKSKTIQRQLSNVQEMPADNQISGENILPADK